MSNVQKEQKMKFQKCLLDFASRSPLMTLPKQCSLAKHSGTSSWQNKDPSTHCAQGVTPSWKACMFPNWDKGCQHAKETGGLGEWKGKALVQWAKLSPPAKQLYSGRKKNVHCEGKRWIRKERRANVKRGKGKGTVVRYSPDLYC